MSILQINQTADCYMTDDNLFQTKSHALGLPLSLTSLVHCGGMCFDITISSCSIHSCALTDELKMPKDHLCFYFIHHDEKILKLISAGSDNLQFFNSSERICAFLSTY